MGIIISPTDDKPSTTPPISMLFSVYTVNRALRTKDKPQDWMHAELQSIKNTAPADSEDSSESEESEDDSEESSESSESEDSE